MKWYAYPLALVAWLLVAVYIFIFSWNYLGDAASPDWSYWLLVVAGFYLLVSILLSKFNLAWELDGLIQVALVLGPLLWYLNLREPYKPPVYVFLIEAGYEGEARVMFTNDEATKTQVRSTADSLYFRFDGQGKILLNEDFRTVRDAIENQFYFLYPDGSRKKINVIAKNSKVTRDTINYVAYEDTIVSSKGNIQYISWKITRADRASAQ